MNKIVNYIKEAYAEMKKVTWPSKKETSRYTVLVIIISVATAAFLGLLDKLFGLGFEYLIMQ